MIGWFWSFNDQGGVEASCGLHGPGVGFCGNIASGPALLESAFRLHGNMNDIDIAHTAEAPRAHQLACS